MALSLFEMLPALDTGWNWDSTAQHSPTLPGRSNLAGAGEAAASVLFQSKQELQNPWKIEILDSQIQTLPFSSCLKSGIDAWGRCCHPPLPTPLAPWSSLSVPTIPCPFRAQQQWHRVPLNPRLSEPVSKAVRESEKSKCKISRFCGTAGTDSPYVPHTHHQSAGKCSQLPASHFAVSPGWICQGDVAASPRPQERLSSVCPRWTFLLAGL